VQPPYSSYERSFLSPIFSTFLSARDRRFPIDPRFRRSDRPPVVVRNPQTSPLLFSPGAVRTVPRFPDSTILRIHRGRRNFGFFPLTGTIFFCSREDFSLFFHPAGEMVHLYENASRPLRRFNPCFSSLERRLDPLRKVRVFSYCPGRGSCPFVDVVLVSFLLFGALSSIAWHFRDLLITVRFKRALGWWFRLFPRSPSSPRIKGLPPSFQSNWCFL